MARQRITWTVLPNGITTVPGGAQGGLFRLNYSVLVAPRLLDGATLADFPDWGLVGSTSRTWPDTLDGVQFSLALLNVPGPNGSPPLILPATPAASLLGGAAPGPQGPFSPAASLWNALFPSNTPVTSFQMPDHSQTKFHSAPVGLAADFLTSTYASLGTTSPDQFPPYTALNEPSAFGAFGFEDNGGDRNPGTRASLEGLLDDALKKHRAVPYLLQNLTPNHVDQTALALLQFQDFHTRGLTDLAADDPGNPPTNP